MRPRTRAQNFLKALTRIEDPVARSALLEPYIKLYLKYFPNSKNLPRGELEQRTLEFLQKVASGEIEITEEELLDKSAVHPELVRYWEEALEKGQVTTSSPTEIRELFLQIKQAKVNKESLVRALKESGVGQPENVAENLKEALGRVEKAGVRLQEGSLAGFVENSAREAGVFISKEKAKEVAAAVSESPLVKKVLEGELAPDLASVALGRTRVRVSPQAPSEEPAKTSVGRAPQPKESFFYLRLISRRPSFFRRLISNLPFLAKPDKTILQENLKAYDQAINQLQSLNPVTYSEDSLVIQYLRSQRETILQDLLEKKEGIQELEFIPDTPAYLGELKKRLDPARTRLVRLLIDLEKRAHQTVPISLKRFLAGERIAVSPSVLKFLRATALPNFLKNLFSRIARGASSFLANPWVYFGGGLSLGVLGLVLPLPAPLKVGLVGAGGVLAASGGKRIPGIGTALNLGLRRGVLVTGRILLGAITSGFGPAGAALAVVILILPVALLLVFLLRMAQISQLAEIIGGPVAEGSPFISITKTANPTCMNRPGCPGFGTVTYKVSIAAKQGPLTNIRVSNNYRVISEGGAPVPTPKIAALSSLPEQINPGQPFEFEYSITLGPEYDNSIVIDSITVTADAPDSPAVSASGSASVIIGNPPAQCPLAGGEKRDGSYNPGDETRGHGSDAYWERMERAGNRRCEWRLPQEMCDGPLNSGNICSKRNERDNRQFCSFYGYALDVFPLGNTDVIAPNIDGQPVVWSYVRRFPNGANARAGHSFVYTDTARKYTLILSHLNGNANTGSNIPSGEKIGSLFPQGDNTHLHIEFQVDGAYQKPEDYFCF